MGGVEGGASGQGGQAGDSNQGGAGGVGEQGGGGVGAGGNAGSAGQETCPENTADCDADDQVACETNLQQSKEHCGACGHSCLGGECVAGECKPFEIVKTSENPYSIAVDSQYLFWVQGNGDVGRYNLKTEETKILASAGGTPRMIALGDSSVFWATYEGGGGKVLSVPKEGGEIKELATGQINPCGVAVGGTYLYWTTGYNANQGSGNIWRSNLDGSNPQSIVSGKHLFSVFAAPGVLSWVNSYESGSVYRASLDASNADAVANSVAWAVSTFSNGTHTAWVSDGSADGKGEVHVKETGGISVSLAKNRSFPRSVLIDQGFVLWANSGQLGGTIERAPVSGGATETLTNGQLAPWGLAVDASSIYWSNRTGNTIMRLAK